MANVTVIISTAAELAALRVNELGAVSAAVSNGDTVTVELGADIDMTGADITAAAQNVEADIDGCGYTVSGISCVKNDISYVFLSVSGSVRNIHFDKVRIYGAYSMTFIASSGTQTFENITFTDSVIHSKGAFVHVITSSVLFNPTLKNIYADMSLSAKSSIVFAEGNYTNAYNCMFLVRCVSADASSGTTVKMTDGNTISEINNAYRNEYIGISSVYEMRGSCFSCYSASTYTAAEGQTGREIYTAADLTSDFGAKTCLVCGLSDGWTVHNAAAESVTASALKNKQTLTGYGFYVGMSKQSQAPQTVYYGSDQSYILCASSGTLTAVNGVRARFERLRTGGSGIAARCGIVLYKSGGGNTVIWSSVGDVLLDDIAVGEVRTVTLSFSGNVGFESGDRMQFTYTTPGDSSGNPWFSGRGWERNVRTDVTLENNAGFYYYPFASNGVSASYPTFTITDQTAWSIDTSGVINDGFPYISTVGTRSRRAYTGIARMDGGHLKEVYAKRKSGSALGGSLRVKVWETS